MINIIKTDKANQIATLEITKDDLEKIIFSLDNMADKLQRNLLENIPSNESDRARLDDYKELSENLAKILNIDIYLDRKYIPLDKDTGLPHQCQ
jgi:hypothetical protein